MGWGWGGVLTHTVGGGGVGYSPILWVGVGWGTHPYCGWGWGGVGGGVLPIALKL